MKRVHFGCDFELRPFCTLGVRPWIFMTVEIDVEAGADSKFLAVSKLHRNAKCMAVVHFQLGPKNASLKADVRLATQFDLVVITMKATLSNRIEHMYTSDVLFASLI